MAKRDGKVANNAGNLYLIFLGILLVLMGGFFMFFMGLGYLRANETRSWVETECKILASDVFSEERTMGKVDYQWRGLYEYQIDGKVYRSDRYEPRGAKWQRQQERVDKIVEKFPAGSEQKCFVNPADHSYAILKHDSRGAGYSIWFPGLFAVGGVGMIVGAIRKWNRVEKVESSE